jgi:glutaminase
MCVIKNIIGKIYENIKNIEGGKIADYIPELACVDPKYVWN